MEVMDGRFLGLAVGRLRWVGGGERDMVAFISPRDGYC